MFSGIVETIGKILAANWRDGCMHFIIAPAQAFLDINIGDSIAINGACLTVTEFTAELFHVTAVPETLRLTNLHTLTVGAEVNLERALKLGARIGGHYVQGHVDGIGEIIGLEHDQSTALLVNIRVDHTFMKYIVNKGYITLDGMSITVINAHHDNVTVTLIPHTKAVTIAKKYRVGSLVNIEVDMMAKHVEKLLGEKMYAVNN